MHQRTDDDTASPHPDDVVVGHATVHQYASAPLGRTTEWNARWHRKRRQLRRAHERDLSWWIASLFLAGSLLFIVGGVLAIPGNASANWLNLAGATLFSIGAVGGVVEASRAAASVAHPSAWQRLLATAGGRAAVVQAIAAVVLFQLAMIVGVLPSMSWVQVDLLLWTPSTVGSVGFVWSSRVFWLEARPADDIGTRAAICNLGGSGCFLVGSVLGFFGQGPIDLLDTNAGPTPAFLAGSFLFGIGSVLSILELETPIRTIRTAPAN